MGNVAHVGSLNALLLAWLCVLLRFNRAPLDKTIEPERIRLVIVKLPARMIGFRGWGPP